MTETETWVIAGGGDLIDQMRPGGNDGNGGEAPPVTGTGTPPAYGENAEVDGGIFGNPMIMLLVWGAVFAGMWFFLIRPQRNREKKMKEMQATIGAGDNIVTSGGLFGKVADVGDDCFIVDFGTNRTMRIPVLKADVVAVRSPKMTPQPKDAPKDDEK